MAILAFGSACATLGPDFGVPPPEKIEVPARPKGAPTGSAFLKSTANVMPEEREDAIFKEISRGNTPSFMWNLKPVKVSSRFKGRRHQGRVWVTPDYLAVGNDRDYVRIPMTPITAQRVADAYGCVLPTRKLVDAIYDQAAVKLKPQTLRPGPLMITNGFYGLHNRMVQKQLGRRRDGRLVAGHKKDVVVSNLLWTRPQRVAIYGWHTRSQHPIQPLSIFHINSYADYSHGIRLVYQWMEVDGEWKRVADVLRDPELSGLISDEGKIPSPRVAFKDATQW